MRILYKSDSPRSHNAEFPQYETAKRRAYRPPFHIHQYSLTTALTRPMISASVPSMGS